MKKLKEVPTTLYCIKVDYFMWSEEKGEYTEPLYWCLDDSKHQIVIFEEDINFHGLRVFDNLKSIQTYMKKHDVWNALNYENPQIVKIAYNYGKQKWEEVG